MGNGCDDVDVDDQGAVLGYTGLSWTVLGCAGPTNNELKGLVKMIKVRNAVIDRYWAVLDCSGLYCALVGSTGLSWAANGRDRDEGGEGVDRGDEGDEGVQKRRRKGGKDVTKRDRAIQPIDHGRLG